LIHLTLIGTGAPMNPLQKAVTSALTLSMLLIGTASEVTAQVASFRASNYRELFIRHRGYLGFAEPIEASDSAGRKDATYWIRPGLAGSCASLESYNYPGHFLRHSGFRIRLDKENSDRLFQEDATWCIVDGMIGEGTKSLRSYNYPERYIRHRNSELWVDKSDGSELFRRDGSFVMQWGNIADRTDLPLILTTRIERHQLGAWVYVSGRGFTPNARVELRVEGLTGMQGPKSTGLVITTRPDGSFGDNAWDGRTWPRGGDAQMRAIDQGSGLSTKQSIPPLY
jgi:hypothetical protein